MEIRNHPSVFRRSWQFIRGLPYWISIPLLAIFLAVTIPTALTGLFMAMMGLMIADDSRGHHRLAAEMAAGDFAQLTTANMDLNKPQPTLFVASPDGTWQWEAKWNKKGFYDWELMNHITGRVFDRGGSIRDIGCGGPSRVCAIWSSDSHYVAINSLEDGFWRTHIISLNDHIPQYVDLSEASLLNSPSLVEGNGESIQEIQAKALGWTNNSTLKTVIFVRSYSSLGPYDIDGGAHATFHFTGSKCEVLEKKSDFREQFIADL
jgi:hypothetical protein